MSDPNVSRTVAVVDDDGRRKLPPFDPVFKNGYADRWHFAVPEAFASALDIRLTKRVKNKDRPKGTPAVYEEILTQGDIYSFQNEDVIYDSPKATEPGVTWGEALWHFTKRMRVTLATSGADGIVHFEIWCPDIAEGTVRKQSEYVTTQAEFVRYLKTGKLPN